MVELLGLQALTNLATGDEQALEEDALAELEKRVCGGRGGR